MPAAAAVFSEETEEEYRLKLLGLASRHINEEFRLFVELIGAALLLAAAADAPLLPPPHKIGSCGLELEKALLVFSFPSRIGRQGVQGWRAKRIYGKVKGSRNFLRWKREQRSIQNMLNKGRTKGR